MNEIMTTTTKQCPKNECCAIAFSIANSIANEEDALACILNAECAKINKILQTYSDLDSLIAIDTSVQVTLERITALEGVLQAKLDAILPLLEECL